LSAISSHRLAYPRKPKTLRTANSGANRAHQGRHEGNSFAHKLFRDQVNALRDQVKRIASGKHLRWHSEFPDAQEFFHRVFSSFFFLYDNSSLAVTTIHVLSSAVYWMARWSALN